MSGEQETEPPPRLPWWRSAKGMGLVAAVFVLGVVVAGPLLSMLTYAGWLIVLAALSAWLVGPDLWWAWREHPEVVRQGVRLVTHPRSVRVLLYLALAWAWFATLF